MLKERIIPCLLLQNSGLVKTIKFSNPKYIGDPINAVKIFNNKEVDELIFLDITATTNSHSPNLELLSDIMSEAFMPFSYGGGIKELNDIEKVLRIGAEKVIINTSSIKNPEFIKQASIKFGSQSVIVSIDVKRINNKYEIFIKNGKEATGISPVDFAVQIEKMGAGEIFLNSIDKDGTMEGYNLDLIKEVSQVVNIPVIVCGGAKNNEDFNRAIKAGASAVSAGSMFVFFGPNKAVLINYSKPKNF